MRQPLNVSAELMGKHTILLLAVVLLIAQPGIIACTKPDSWSVQSPPDKSFAVELPAPLRRVETFSGEHGASLDRSQTNHWASCYASIEATLEESHFGVVVINARQKFIRAQERNGPYGLYWYLGAILIGNEDEPQPTSVKAIDVNGMKGKEYIYTRGGVSTRGRIFETGGKIYVVVFVGKDDNDLTSPDANRFLNSFRVHRQNKR